MRQAERESRGKKDRKKKNWLGNIVNSLLESFTATEPPGNDCTNANRRKTITTCKRKKEKQQTTLTDGPRGSLGSKKARTRGKQPGKGGDWLWGGNDAKRNAARAETKSGEGIGGLVYQ